MGRGVAILAVLVVAAGCGNHAPPPAPVSPTTVRGADDIQQYTIRWIENPTLDLMSPAGTFVRAAAESLSRMFFGRDRGAAGLADAGYPGFVHAFHNVEDPNVVAGTANTADRMSTSVGTDYYEVVELRHEGDQYTIGYCDYWSMIASTQGDGQYASRGTDLFANHHKNWLTFGPDPALPPEQQRAPKAHQRGEARAPADDVFGTWIITSWDDFKTLGDLPQCRKLAPGTPADWPHGEYVRSTPPPTLPPSPGWPPGGSA